MEKFPATLAYIRVIGLKEALAMGMKVPRDMRLPKDVKLYALCNVEGFTLGITDSRENAVSAAIENDFVPLSVH
jgi:hypothetical protein